MGFWSDLKEGFMEGYNQAKSEQADTTDDVMPEINILFKPSHNMAVAGQIRKEAMEILFTHINKLLGLEIKESGIGTFYTIMPDDGNIPPMWLNFVVYNGEYLIQQGTCGMGLGGLTIIGGNKTEALAQEIMNILSFLEFEEIQLHNERIPFHETEWLTHTAISMHKKVQVLKERISNR